MKWQSIETAPKDGSSILVYTGKVSDKIERVRWYNDEWVVVTAWWHVANPEIISSRLRQALEEGSTAWDDCLPDEIVYRPTHWMPLPEGPKE